FARSFHLGNQDIFASASIGVAVSQDSDLEPNDLLRRADTAMYEAKKHGKSGYVIFDPSMKMQPERVQDIGSEVQSAVQEKSFEIFFQPIVTIDGLEIKEFEVQVRWQHPTLGRISPQKLEILLREQGLLDSVREWNFSESCRHLSDWSKSYIGPDEVKMSVNISRHQMIDPDLCTNILDTVTELGIQPRQITIEVSESEVLADLDRMRSVFRTIKSQGFRIAIDNFGTGQSSMDYLNDLPLDALKIDRNIIDQIGEDESADRILKSIIDAAHRLKLSVVADGVETSEQSRVLKELNCDLGQGSALANSLTTQELGIRLGHPESKGIGKVL
ncbi:MAG: GGDEF domain-containing phosphodiesterase, partial [Armatimonadota bacterium]